MFYTVFSQQKNPITHLTARPKHLPLEKLWSSCLKEFGLSEDKLSTEEGKDLYAYLDTEAVTRVEDFSLEVARE